MSCKYLDTGEDKHCLIVYQITNDYFTPSPEDCQTCMRCEEGVGVNEFTMLQANLLGVELHKELLGKGPGTRLAKLISWFIQTPPNCDCESRKNIMDLWGPKGCEENRDIIRHWLRTSARENVGFVPDCVLDTIITAAIKTSPLPRKQ